MSLPIIAMSVIPLSTAALQMSSNCDTSSVFSRSGFTSSLHLKGGGAKTKRNKKGRIAPSSLYTNILCMNANKHYKMGIT